MSDGPSSADESPATGRRLTLTPIGFDIALALAQAPDGMRLSGLAQAIGSPVSSVQAALRSLVANGLAQRDATIPPRYRLREAHPARRELVALATVLPDPAHVSAIALRANEGVAFAAVDRGGFIAAFDRDVTPELRQRLAETLSAVARARADAPPVELNEANEFQRLLAVSVGLRARVREAIPLKGRRPRGSELPAAAPRTPSGQLVL
jgi:hypothetical protein